MVEETMKQRLERLVQERNIPALLTEAQHFLAIYLDGDDSIDLEPIVSAQAILQETIALFTSQEDQKALPITSVTRTALKDAGIPKSVIAQLTDEDIERITKRILQTKGENES